MTDAELIEALEFLRDSMMAVATGGPRIAEVNDQFKSTYAAAASALSRRGLPNPMPYGDLWGWHGRWSSGDMPTYRSRRTYVSELFTPLLNRIQSGRAEPYEDTGWPRVDRTVGELRDRLAAARSEEQLQAVGLLAREVLISIAQAVFDPERHLTQDGVKASSTDAKRMLDAYIAAELADAGNEEARRHARSALDLAVALQHRRTATFREAAMCAEATTAVVNIIAIASGRRDPQA
jgi:hypothetical protein